jgi:tight adherence protein C
VSKLVGAKLVLAVLAAGLGVLVISARASAFSVLLVLGVTVVAYFVPELLLYSRGQERQAAISLELADTLDQMTIAVEAGLGFESAMSRAGKNGKGPLAEELVRTLQDIAVGQPRREAYLAMAERAGVQDLGRFIRAVVQADAYGVSIADVLRAQASEMRLKRRQRAEEKAMQIPVKVIFPLILCILPTLFIVLLGPAVIQIIGVFSK